VSPTTIPFGGAKLATVTGPVVMIGMGSIGRGTLPLLDRHIDFDHSRAIALDPLADKRKYADEYGISFLQVEITPDNYVEVLTPLLTNGDGQGFCVNLSVDTGSVDIMRLCRELGALYIDTVVEPWPGLYYNDQIDNADRTNQFLRSQAVAERRRSPGGTTAVSCCGANPGMVSWFVKQALVDLDAEMGLGLTAPAPGDRAEWAKYMRTVGVKGIHIAERDTQRVVTPKPDGHVLEHVVGRRVHLRRPPTCGARMGHTREVDARERSTLRRSRSTGDLLGVSWSRNPGADVVSDSRRAVRLPGDAQRITLDLGLLFRAR